MLWKLNLSWTKLSSLTDSIGSLTRLEEFHLSQSSLTYLPNSIRYLVNLRKLDVSWTRLDLLPDCVGNLPKLEVLDMFMTKCKCFEHVNQCC